MSNKQGIIDNFNILVEYYKVSKEKNSQHRRHAYQNAVRALESLEFEDINSISQVKGVANIGKATRDKIQEYLKTGKIVKAEEARAELVKLRVIPDATEKQISNIATVKYIGQKGAEELLKKGFRDIEDLRKNPNVLNYKQKIGLKYHKDLHTRIPREYITVFYFMCQYILRKEFGRDKYKMAVLGSYKRGSKDSGDIDFLVTSNVLTLRDIVNVLIKWNIIVETIDLKYVDKFTGIAHCPSGQWFYFYLDIVFVPIDSWGAASLSYTGSMAFVRAMRADAARLGFFLNHLGLFQRNSAGEAGQRIPVYTEKEIFKIGRAHV